MKEKIYTHTQGAKLAGAFLNKIYNEMRSTISVSGQKSKVSKLHELTDEQDLALIAITSELDWGFMGHWWQSLIRTGVCQEAKDIERVMLSSDEVLQVVYNFIEVNWAWVHDFSFVLITVEKILEKNHKFIEAINLWEGVQDLLSKDPGHECFNYYPYFGDIGYEFLPPVQELESLTPQQMKRIAEFNRSYLHFLINYI